tara:strand:+ start:265 stop:894 length:630 start_codon:yes stop_codon:yes gene_type:complete
LSLDFELWGAGTARTLRPIWMAEELNLPYKLYPIGPRTGETQTKEYTELNPKQKIPLLKHGDFLLSESLSICRYLQDVSYSNEVFVSVEKKIKALEDQWCNFIYGELDETSLYVMRRHYDLKDIYGEAPEVVQSCREYFEKGLKVVEGTLAKQETLYGVEFSLADILLVTCLDWALAYKFKLPINISNYHNKMKERKAYKKAVEINYNI